MRLRLAAAVVVLVALLAGCGGSTRTSPGPIAQAVRLGVVVPKALISLAPETARRAEGPGNPTANPNPELTAAVLGPIPSRLQLLGSAINIDNAGAGLIEQFEEVQKSTYCPYWDAYGRVWTRGFGETDWHGNFGGRCISHREAVRNLIYLVDHQYLPVIRGLGVNLNHHQVAALASVVWNLGPGVISGSIRYDLQHRLFASAWGILVQYVHAGGVVLSGLVHRRYAERAYFFAADHETPPKTPAQIRSERLHQLNGKHGAIHNRNALRAVQLQHNCNRHRYHHPLHATRRECDKWKHLGGVEVARVKRLKRELGIR